MVSFLSLNEFWEEPKLSYSEPIKGSLQLQLSHLVRGAAQFSISTWHLDRVFIKSESQLDWKKKGLTSRVRPPLSPDSARISSQSFFQDIFVLGEVVPFGCFRCGDLVTVSYGIFLQEKSQINIRHLFLESQSHTQSLLFGLFHFRDLFHLFVCLLLLCFWRLTS